MRDREIKQTIICNLIARGFDFKKDVFTLSSEKSAILSEYAKRVKYKKPKNGYLSTGKHFSAPSKNLPGGQTYARRF